MLSTCDSGALLPWRATAHALSHPVKICYSLYLRSSVLKVVCDAIVLFPLKYYLNAPSLCLHTRTEPPVARREYKEACVHAPQEETVVAADDPVCSKTTVFSTSSTPHPWQHAKQQMPCAPSCLSADMSTDSLHHHNGGSATDAAWPNQQRHHHRNPVQSSARQFALNQEVLATHPPCAATPSLPTDGTLMPMPPRNPCYATLWPRCPIAIWMLHAM